MSRAKLTAAIEYTLLNAGDMEIMRLAKFLYLADYTYAKTFGNKHGFIDEYQRYKYGPVPAEFYLVYNSLLQQAVIGRTGNIVTLIERPTTPPDLTEEEQACLDKIIQDFRGKSLNAVKETAYSTEPMVDIVDEEARLGSGILEFKKMDFSNVQVHPLMQPVDDDLSFMESDAFKDNLKQ